MCKVVDSAGTKSVDTREVNLATQNLCYTLMSFAGVCCSIIIIVAVITITMRIPTKLNIKFEAAKKGKVKTVQKRLPGPPSIALDSP